MEGIRRASYSVLSVASLTIAACAGDDRVVSGTLALPVAAVSTRDLCGDGPGARCFGKVVTNADGEPLVTHAPTGYGANDLQSAYKLPGEGGNGRIVAVVVAFDAPNVESHLGTYRTQYGLPTCTTANGCFTKVNQDGLATPLPAFNAGWAAEAALDVEMVSAGCPDCRILLVEARTSNAVDLGAGVATAASLGAFAISNSYGYPENDPDSLTAAHFYDQAGILVTAASGNDGWGRSVTPQGTIAGEIPSPASLPTVLAVGGTTLTTAISPRGWAETVWQSGGSGCSKLSAKPAWQSDVGCTKRTMADVAVVANPVTGVSYYAGSWGQIGGTDIGAPLVAAALTSINVSSPSWPYANPSRFFDITSGTNGACGTYLCNAGVGYDGPTGIGSPNFSAFGNEDGGADAASDAKNDGATDAGAGGASGSGGAAGAGGTGGSAGTAGAGTTGGSGGTAGAAGSGGAAGTGAGAGGTAGSAGTTGAGGTAGAGGGGGAGGSRAAGGQGGSGGGAGTGVAGQGGSGGAGTGGSGGGAGARDAGSNGGSGGASGATGTSGTGGSNAGSAGRGGAANGGAGAGGTTMGTGGRAGTSGAGGKSSTTGGAAGAANDSDGGCSCTVPGRSSQPPTGATLLLLALAAARSRRARSTSGTPRAPSTARDRRTTR